MRSAEVLILGFLVLFLAGCGPKAAPEPISYVDEEELEEERRQKKIKNDFENIMTYAERNPDKIAKIRKRIRVYASQAKGTVYEDRANKLLRDAEKNFVDRCNHYKDTAIMPKIRRYEADEDYGMCLDVVLAYNPAKLTPDIKQQITEMKERYKKEIEAEEDYWPMMKAFNAKKGLGEYGRARACILAFIENPRFAGTQAVERARPYLEDLAEAEKEQTETEKEDVTGWEPLFDGQTDNFDHAGTDELWSIDGNALVVNNNTDEATVAMIGEENWVNYSVEFRFKLMEGEFAFGVHGVNLGGEEGWGFDSCPPPGPEYEKGVWHEIQVKVDGGTMWWIWKDKNSKRMYVSENPRGPIAFQILPGCRVMFKGIRIKHL